MMYKLLPCICFIVSFFWCGYCFGQTASGDSTAQAMASSQAVGFFNAAIDQQSRLYNGPEYNLYDPAIKGNAYFQDIYEFRAGSVFYDGIIYNNVPMMYDMNKDIVAVLLYNNFSRFSLLNERLPSFDLFNHHFVYITADSLNTSSPIRTGFYDEVYKGNLQALVKWTKNIQTSSNGNNCRCVFYAEQILLPQKRQYLLYNRRAKRTAESFKGQEKRATAIYKSQQENPDKAMALIAARYDQL